jgi:hypothetical protein
MNPFRPIRNRCVIPAKAGIRLINKFPRSGTAKFGPLRVSIFLPDSRFRGNDAI